MQNPWHASRSGHRTRSVTGNITRLLSRRVTVLVTGWHMHFAPNRFSIALRPFNCYTHIPTLLMNHSVFKLSSRHQLTSPPCGSSEIVDDSEPEREERRQRLQANKRSPRASQAAQKMHRKTASAFCSPRKTVIADHSVVEISGEKHGFSD